MSTIPPRVRLRVLPRLLPQPPKQVELQATDDFIQWRYIGDAAWVDLIAVSDLIGPAGPSVELRVNGAYVQYRVLGAPTWTNLIALADLAGPQGIQGPQGPQGPVSPVFTGDSGSGGTAGNVPAPSAGDASAAKYLSADGTWKVIPTPNIRERLTANKTLYVRLDGNDSNNGSANNAANAFRTVQAAYNFACARYDLAGFVLKIKVADGTYPDQFAANRLPVGAQGAADVVIEGNLTTPANVLFAPAAGIPVDLGAANGFGSTIMMTLAGFKVQGAGMGMRILGGGATVLLDRVDFGTCGTIQIYVGHDAFVYCSTFGIVISGNAQYHAFVYTKATYVQESIPVTFLNSPAFQYAYIVATQAALVLVGAANYINKGSVTGPRYNITSFAHIDTQNGGGSPTTFLPGSEAGFASAQGLID